MGTLLFDNARELMAGHVRVLVISGAGVRHYVQAQAIGGTWWRATVPIAGRLEGGMAVRAGYTVTGKIEIT